MPRPLTRVQQKENVAFLRHLRRTGNVSAAAQAIGFKRERFIERRRKHPAFALLWDAALVTAHAALANDRGTATPPPAGEAYICLSRRRKRQMRRARRGLVDHPARQRFLAALSATANVALSAAAAGFNPGTLYRHRQHNPAFKREWQLALEIGYERVEMALIEGSLPESFSDDDWRRNDPPAIPPMSPDQALQLLTLHQKEARLWDTPIPWERLRPGQTMQARSVMLGMIDDARRERERMRVRIAEAERLARGEPTRFDWSPGELPDLSQVTGWSKASSKPPADASRALFGGWRLEDIPAGKRKGKG